ncbi:riboflavin synthase [Kiritimatiella glycovorans]|uniref:Riboflavin synthase n=1 Tax=Kiritimatiella glycovorans TaxID=1307763 RepID=A0A0G3EEW6_9BACT|nr:riboflavin synthase [Kiritimatiella glycovorans]AKJ65016.1 Riboflavin synthase [Kiritimatiella glycovorans]
MFTGIIDRLGEVKSIEMEGEAGRITLRPDRPWERPVKVGDSIAVNGACLTVAEMDGEWLMFDVLKETFDKTCLGEKKAGDRLNLERALALGDTLGGHMVTGHVDGLGEIAAIDRVERDWKFSVQCSREMQMLLVYKGSIALDGISLTVAELRPDGFVVYIIPHTMEQTDMSDFEAGTKVNLEADILGKYVRRILEFGGGQTYRMGVEG